MKQTRVLIILCTLLVAVQFADAAQGSQRLQRPPSSRTAGGDMLATNMIVTDPMVLPLLGMSDHIEGRLAFLKTELKITQAQLPLWNSFAGAARANATQERALIDQEFSAIDHPHLANRHRPTHTPDALACALLQKTARPNFTDQIETGPDFCAGK